MTPLFNSVDILDLMESPAIQVTSGVPGTSLFKYLETSAMFGARFASIIGGQLRRQEIKTGERRKKLNAPRCHDTPRTPCNDGFAIADVSN